jgi:hypothetical protein
MDLYLGDTLCISEEVERERDQVEEPERQSLVGTTALNQDIAQFLNLALGASQSAELQKEER